MGLALIISGDEMVLFSSNILFSREKVMPTIVCKFEIAVLTGELISQSCELIRQMNPDTRLYSRF